MAKKCVMLQRSPSTSSSVPLLCKRGFHTTKQTAGRVIVPIDDKDEQFSPILLRDLCKCPACVHEHTRQRLYSTADIPIDIRARSVNLAEPANDTVNIHWEHDVPGFDSQHSTSISIDALRAICKIGVPPSPSQGSLLKQMLWDGRIALNCM